MLAILSIASIVLASSFASPVTQNCSTTMKAAGASNIYAGIVAHGIHSITVEQLRKFKPGVTENNLVPTVNKNLISDEPVLLNAPNEPDVGKTFKTDGMRAVDQVLSHMDDKTYDVKGYGPLERLVHVLHMQAVWDDARVQYEHMKAQPPSTEVCQCARDTEKNGVMEAVRYIALKIREPELMLGKHLKLSIGGDGDRGDKPGDWKGNIYSAIADRAADGDWKGNIYSAVADRVPDGDWKGNIYSAVADRATENVLLQKKEEAFPKLVNEAAWAEWKKAAMSMGPNDAIDLALYLYCALNA